MSEQKSTKLIIVHQIVRVEFSEVVAVPADFSQDETTRLVSDFWNITDRNKVVTAAELMEPGVSILNGSRRKITRPAHINRTCR